MLHVWNYRARRNYYVPLFGYYYGYAPGLLDVMDADDFENCARHVDAQMKPPRGGGSGRARRP